MTDLVSLPPATQKQEVRLISEGGQRQCTTVQYIGKEDVLTHSCTYTDSYPDHMARPGLCAWLWSVIYDQRCAGTVFLCVVSSKWAHCFTICRKEIPHTRQILFYEQNLSHSPRNVVSSKGNLVRDKGPCYLLAAGILWADLQHCHVEVKLIVWAGTHSQRKKVSNFLCLYWKVCVILQNKYL